MWGLSGLLQAMLPSFGDGQAALVSPRALLVSQGYVEVPQGCGWSWAGSYPWCRRREAEV